MIPNAHFVRNCSRIALACAALLLGASQMNAAAPERPMVVAHRGGALLLPENTFPAFDNAVRLGVDMLEFDMVMTADDRIVISHDPVVDPTFCTPDKGSGIGAGPVRKMTLKQVRRFDCGSRHRAIYPTQKAVPGARMPTLDAFLKRYRGKKGLYFAETKMPKAGQGEVDPAAFARLIAAAVRRHGAEDRFILQSSDYRTIDAMHAINPRIRTCLLSPWRFGKDYLGLARKHHAMCMLLRLQDADAAEVRRLREAGVQVFSDVVDTEQAWRAYLERGGDAIFTNDPAGLIAFLNGASPAD